MLLPKRNGLLHHYRRGLRPERQLVCDRGRKDVLLMIATVLHDKPIILRGPVRPLALLEGQHAIGWLCVVVERSGLFRHDH